MPIQTQPLIKQENDPTVVENTTIAVTNPQSKEDATILLKDPKATVEASIKKLQTLSLALKDRNLTGKKRKDVEAELEASVESYILLISACINNNILDSDKTGILKGETSNKYFKDYTGHINKLAKKALAKQSKVEAYKGAPLSESELAKLVETPYHYKPKSSEEDTTVYDDKGMAIVDKKEVPQANGDSVVEIECTDGSKVTVDKNDSALYTDVVNDKGETVSLKRKILLTGLTWYETAKNIAIGIFGFVWNTVKTIAGFGSTIVVGAIGTVTASGAVFGTGMFQGISKLKDDICSAHKRASFKVNYK